MSHDATPDTVGSVGIVAGDDHNMAARAHGIRGISGVGSVFVGPDSCRIQVSGTPGQIRSLAKALEDGAMELDRQLAEKAASAGEAA